MENNSEVVGWVLVDDAAHVLVRQESEGESQPTMSAAKAFEHFAVQTGSFRRNQLIELVTRQALGNESNQRS